MGPKEWRSRGSGTWPWLLGRRAVDCSPVPEAWIDSVNLTVDFAYVNILHTCLFRELDAVARPNGKIE
jgi:hypothetical protein